MIKTKIIATLGPSCDQKETIKPMKKQLNAMIPKNIKLVGI